MRNVNKDVWSVSFYLREGDVTSMISKSDSWDESISDMIRSRDALIVPVIGTKNDG